MVELSQKDIKAIVRYDKDFDGKLLEPNFFLEYPITYRYILLKKSLLHGSGYPSIVVLGKGLDKKFYLIDTHDCIDFDGGIKVDFYKHLVRVQALDKKVTAWMGILKVFLATW